jgi:hypothetical protein
MNIVSLKAKPNKLEAIQWTNNEAEIRQFVQEDTKLNFRDEGLKVWHEDSYGWINCPMFYWIIKDRYGNLKTVSPEKLADEFEVE